MEQEKHAARFAALRKPDPAQARLLRRIVLIALAVVMAASVCLVIFGLRGENLRTAANTTFNGVMQKDSLYAMDIDEKAQIDKVKETPRGGQTAKFRYFTSTYLRLDYAFAYTPIVFGNVSSNDEILVFSIVDDESGILMYRSGGIEPGNYVSQIRLLHAYSAGEYTCRMYVTAYDRETYACRGVQYTDLTVMVGG